MSSLKNLIALAKNLQKEEKRMVSIALSGKSGDRKHTELWQVVQKEVAKQDNIPQDILLEQTEQAIRSSMVRKKLVRANDDGRTLYSMADYLINAVLKVLRNGNVSENAEERLRAEVQEAKILYRLGLFAWAIRRMEQTLEDAVLYAYYPIQLELLKDLIYVHGQLDTKAYAEKINEYLVKLKEAQTNVALECQAFAIHYESFILLRTGTKAAQAQDKVKAIKERLEQLTKQDNLPLISTVYTMHAGASLASLESNYKEAKEIQANILENWDKHPEIAQERLRTYIVYLYNYLNYCVLLRDFEGYNRYFHKLKDTEALARNFDEKAEAFQNILYIQQLYYANTNQFKAAAEWINSNAEQLTHYAFKINKARLFAMYFASVQTFFIIQDLESASYWCQAIRKMEESEQRKDIQAANWIFEQVIGFELVKNAREYEYIEANVTNLIARMRYNKLYGEYESIFLNGLKSIIGAATQYGAKHQHCIQKYEELESKITEKKDTLNIQWLEGAEVLEFWVKSKIKGRSIEDLILQP